MRTKNGKKNTKEEEEYERRRRRRRRRRTALMINTGAGTSMEHVCHYDNPL